MPAATNGINRILALDSGGANVDGSLYPFENITNFGAVSHAADNRTPLLAAIAVRRTLYIPAGQWKWSGQIAAAKNSIITWFIDPNAQFPDVPSDPVHGIPDLTTLGGRVIWMNRISGTALGMRFGGPQIWIEDLRPHSLAVSETAIMSAGGDCALTVASRASDNPAGGSSCIGLQSIMHNDSAEDKRGTWGGYIEVTRESNAGYTFGFEIDVVNWGQGQSGAHPFYPLLSNGTLSTGLWMAAGAEYSQSFEPAAVMGVLQNGVKWERGIVFFNNSLNETIREALTLPQNYRVGWYPNGSGSQSFIDGDHLFLTALSDTQNAGVNVTFRRRKADGSNSASGDYICQIDFAGYNSGTTNMSYVRSRQMGNFSGGYARSSLELGARNSDGTTRDISLNAIANNTFGCSTDNVLNLGGASNRFKEIFCANGTINTSDRNLKADIQELTDAERRVAARIRTLVKSYLWQESVAEKGERARRHIGVVAQEVIEAFEAEGLDPWRYGALCRDEIVAQVEVKRTGKRQKTERSSVTEVVIEVENGRAVKRTVTREEMKPVTEEIPLFDEDGRAVMEPVYERVLEDYEDQEGPKERFARKAVGERQATYVVPVMEDFEEAVTEFQPTGEYRLGVRYEELAMFVLAAEA